MALDTTPHRIGPAFRRFLGNTLYETFEHLVMLTLTVVIVVLIAVAAWHLVLTTYALLANGELDPGNPVIYPNVFAMFFTVLIGLEFKRSFLIVSSTQTSVVRIRSIILIGLLATLRKFIILDLKEINVLEVLAVAGAILSLGIVYWLVRDQETRALDQQMRAAASGLPSAES
ncbi:phosphate-starvation-inducible PsiE family protein [Acidisoma cladoniae]|jgi:uncharacterized membrane protein (DUF373 family)|uniref:phosphate-starvation-inducible PsiE family protein n=1 Tax=Acidisoma cladoniae TaxID=3040935 RepID=UPI00254B8339|nr:phosphate-starvation-inducible PsiE family protein [Acidisoma sp. PAMC 29798]